jgi:hypothetical protein
VLVGVRQRNRINKLCIYREIYFKELALTLWELASLKSAGQAQDQLEG